jgi:hypothetical protein
MSHIDTLEKIVVENRFKLNRERKRILIPAWYLREPDELVEALLELAGMGFQVESANDKNPRE